MRGRKNNIKAEIKNKSVWTDHEDSDSEDTEAGLLVGHKLAAGQPCTPDTKAEMAKFITLFFREMFLFYEKFCSSSFAIWKRTKVLKVFKAWCLNGFLSLKLWTGLLTAACGKGKINNSVAVQSFGCGDGELLQGPANRGNKDFFFFFEVPFSPHCCGYSLSLLWGDGTWALWALLWFSFYSFCDSRAGRRKIDP